MGRRRALTVIRWLAAATAAVTLLTCLNPMNEDMLLHVKDVVQPGITISSPADGSSYAATVIVTGTVADFSTASGDGGRVAALSYEIVPATIPGGDVPFSADGSFTFQFPTAGFSGPMVVRITARDWNGNQAQASISLAQLEQCGA